MDFKDATRAKIINDFRTSIQHTSDELLFIVRRYDESHGKCNGKESYGPAGDLRTRCRTKLIFVNTKKRIVRDVNCINNIAAVIADTVFLL